MNRTGVYDGTPHPYQDIDQRDTTGHLKTEGNTIRFQAIEDYAVPSVPFLMVEIEPTAEGASTSTSSEQSAEEIIIGTGVFYRIKKIDA